MPDIRGPFTSNPKRLERLDRVQADTLVGRAMRISGTLTLPDEIVTGTGDFVLADSPTIVTPTIASFTNAQHDHQDADDGGTLTHSALVVPAVRVYNTTNQTIDNTTVTILTFDSERFDTASMHDTSSNTSRITIPVAGIYRFTATIGFEAAMGAATRVITSLKLNGTTYIGRMETNKIPSTNLVQCCTCIWQCAANDYVEVDVYQDSGVASSTLVIGAAICPEFSAERIA